MPDLPAQFGSLALHTGMDPAELGALLPPGARQRFEILTLRREDMHRLVPEGDTVRLLNVEKFGAEHALQKMLASASDGGHSLPEDDLRVIAARRNVDRLTHEAKAIAERYAQRGQAFQAVARVHADTLAWLVNGRPVGTTLEDYDGAEPKLNGKESLLDAVQRLQRRGRELKSDLARISAAPFPSDHCKQRMREEIEVLAQRGAPSMALMIEHDGETGWPQTNLRGTVYNSANPSFAATETVDTLALFAWLHRDQLIAALDREIDAEADDASALTHEAREQQAAEVQADLLDIERQEASLMFRAWADGLSIQPRPDLAPAAWLGVQLVTAAPAQPGSSPMHAGYDLVSGGRR
ncbi:MAG: hypothetical protein WAO08_12415 [Hyphomicrobiaceae bacterium]